MADTKEFQEFAKFMDAIKAYAKIRWRSNTIRKWVTSQPARRRWCTKATGASMLKDFGDFGSNIGMMPLPIDGNKKLTVGVASYWVVNGQPMQMKSKLQTLSWIGCSIARQARKRL